ncbi:MAG: hypothetical protein EZS28_044816, partial [Streblomastix strix]
LSILFNLNTLALLGFEVQTTKNQFPQIEAAAREVTSDLEKLKTLEEEREGEYQEEEAVEEEQEEEQELDSEDDDYEFDGDGDDEMEIGEDEVGEDSEVTEAYQRSLMYRKQQHHSQKRMPQHLVIH